MLECNKDRIVLKRAWLSLLVQPGSVIWKPGAADSAIFVLSVSCFGILGWSVAAINRHGFKTFQLQSEKGAKN